jgi:hypothetical protein
MDDKQLDAFLTDQLADSALPDHGFTQAVRQRVRGHRHRRRAVLACAGVLATALAVALPGTTDMARVFLAGPSTVVSLMVLTAACGLVWIGTESRG